MDQSISVRWNELKQRRWEAFLKTVPYSPYQQHWAYGDAIRRFGGDVQRAAIYDADSMVGVAQVQVRRIARVFPLATMLMGPVWRADPPSLDVKRAAFSALRQTAPFKGLHALLVMPPEPALGAELTGMRSHRVASSYHTVLIELQADDETLLAAMDGKWRNRLRAAQSAKLKLRDCGQRLANYQWLLEAEQAQRRKMKYKAMSTDFIPYFQSTAGDDAVLCLEAKLEGERVAGILVLVHGRSATYHLGWSNDAGRKASAHNALLWEAMRKLKRRDIRTFDLGGVDTDKGDGLARFKLGTGGKLLSQPGTYCLKPRLL